MRGVHCQWLPYSCPGGGRHNAEAKHAKIDAKRARDVARLKKEITATTQANLVDAQASTGAKYKAHLQPKRSRKRKVPNNNIFREPVLRAPTLARVAEEVVVPEEA